MPDRIDYTSILLEAYQMLGTWQDVTDLFGFDNRGTCWDAANGKNRKAIPIHIRRKFSPLPLAEEDPKRLAWAIKNRQ